MAYGGGNINLAGDFLRRMAPTQTHEGRHAFQTAADYLQGIKLDRMHSPVAVSIPVIVDDKIVGRIEFMMVRYPEVIEAHPFVGQNLFRPEPNDGRTEDDGFVAEGT